MSDHILLIYSGHLLKDEQLLSDIIKSIDDSNTVTFHLVCPQKQTSKFEQINKTSEPINNFTPESTSTSETLASYPNRVSNNTNENLFMNQFNSNNPSLIQESYNTMMSQYYQYMNYYYLYSTTTDLNSYYTFASAYMRGTNLNNNLIIPTLNMTPENNAGNVNQANVAADHRNNVNNNNNIVNNNNNEDVNRDWTDLLYTFSKLMVMLSIMYFYSSFGRLLLLITIAILLYMYKNFRAENLQHLINNNNNVLVREQPQVEQVNNNNNEANNNNNPQSEQQNQTNNVNDDSSNGARENLRYSGIRLVWVFVSSLFTSLIPDPNPIN